MTDGNTYGGDFCSPDEHQITTLGTGYIANFISKGAVEESGATLTNRRIYFSGTTFMFNEKGQLFSIKEQKIVNVRDITGVGYKIFSPIQYIIAGVTSLILGAIVMMMTMEEVRQGWGAHGATIRISSIGGWSMGAGAIFLIVCIFLYFNYRKTLLSIEYAGGNISYDARWLDSGEQDVFIRNIHLAKDALYSMSATEQGFYSDMICENCGGKTKAGSKFCSKCGGEIIEKS